MRLPVENNRSANGLPNVREGLSGRSARGNVAEDGSEIGVHSLDASYANCGVGGWQRGAVTQIDSDGMREMADTAVLVLEGFAVPVAGGLDGKRHDQESHKCGQEAACHPRL